MPEPIDERRHGGPGHPRLPTALLLVGVTALVVLLALGSR
jgi:hypothetical protein